MGKLLSFSVYQSNSKEAHDKAHQAHVNVLEHLKKGDALDQSKKHGALASEHKHLAAAHDASGHEKLKALANAASAHASAHNTVEAHLKAAQAHHAADPNWWEGAFHQSMAKPRVQHVQTSAADALSSSAKTHSEHVDAAKAHYAAGISGYNGRTGTLGEHYENNVIKAHIALQKAAVYPESEHGHPVHPASWAEHHYSDHISSLKENQREALRKYTHGSDQKVNGALREGKTTPMVKHMDLALHSARTPEALTVTRTMATLPASMEKGAIFSDKGYVSTTMHHSGVLYKTAHPVIMEIHIPKGSHGLPLRAVSPTHHKPEEEFLLPRDSKFHIESVEHKDGKVHIKAVVHND